MKALKRLIVISFLWLYTCLATGSAFGLSLSIGIGLGGDRFDSAIQEATAPIQDHLEGPGFASAGGWATAVRDTMITLVQKVIIPALIIIGVMMCIFGFYEIMSSEKDEDQKKWFNYIMWGVIGIIIMMSAAFITSQIVGTGGFGFGGVLNFAGGVFQGNQAAMQLYNLVLYPFLKLVMVIVMGILFLIVIMHCYSFLVNPDEKIKQHARTIILWNALGILVIIFAKALVETIYGKETQVVNGSATTLGDIGGGLLADKSFAWLYVVLNRVMWLVGFVILVIIIVEAVDLLRNPTDEKQIAKVKKNFLYIIIGILIIGTAYVVTNFVLLK